MHANDTWFCCKCQRFVNANQFCSCGAMAGTRLIRTYQAPIVSPTAWFEMSGAAKRRPQRTRKLWSLT